MGGRRLIGGDEEKVSTPWKSVKKPDGYIGEEKNWHQQIPTIHMGRTSGMFVAPHYIALHYHGVAVT